MSSITAWLTGVSNKATYYQHLCYMPSVPWPVYKTPIFPLPPSLCYELLLFQFVLLTLLFYSAILSCHLSQLVAMNFNSSCAPLSFLCLQGFLTYIWTYKRKSTNKRWAFFFFFFGSQLKCFITNKSIQCLSFSFPSLCYCICPPWSNTHSPDNLRSHQTSAFQATGKLHSRVPTLEFQSRKGKLDILHPLSPQQEKVAINVI